MSRSGRGRGRVPGGKRDMDGGWEQWGGYMNAKRQKLQDQFAEETPGQLKKEGSGSRIFSGIVIHVNGYTKPSSDELKRMMMLHGGNYEHYLRRTRVSHVIATNLPDSKIRELRGLKVVRPEWITESIAAGKLLSYTDYQLYTAQTGRQMGLKGFTVRQEENQSDRDMANIENQSVDEDSCKIQKSTSSVYNKTNMCSETACDIVTPNLPDSSESLDKSLSPNSSSLLTYADMHTRSTNSNVIRNNSKHSSLDTNTFPQNKHNTNKENHSPAKAGDPKFLNEYYTNSRLHHLSTWKAEFKDYINELQAKGANYTGREKLRALVQQEGGVNTHGIGKRRRCVMHVDMDCFFVSVGLRKRPDLKGKPIAVTHSKGKGATINPEADFNFEKQRFKQTKQDKKKDTITTGSELDLSFPDASDSEDEDFTMATSRAAQIYPVDRQETFHSMAEIASCSYEARQAGVRNGMFMGTAKRLCPSLVTIPYDFEGYKSVSRILYDIVASYTHDIEAVSCDEMLVDCTDLLADTGASPHMFATQLRQEIYNKTGCPASAGFASNILLAKMATRKAKPNGQYQLVETEVTEFIRDQSVCDIPGVGWSLTKRLDKMDITTCGKLQKLSMDRLQKEFGVKTGQSLYRYCRGQDDRPIKIEQQRKSVSAEVNYGIRFSTCSESIKFVEELAEEVCTRLKTLGMKGKTVTLKLMVRREDAPKETSKFMGHGICNNFSKSTSLPLATNDVAIIKRECVGILKQNKAAPQDLRGIGIQIQKLELEEVGLAATKSKGQSILNFTVDISASTKPAPKESIHTADESLHSGCKTDKPEQPGSCKTRQETSIINTKRDLFNKKSVVCTESDSVNALADNTVPYRVAQEASLPGFSTDRISDLGSLSLLDHVDQDIERPASPVNLVEDIAWRQVSPNKLPPLPNLPDLSPTLSWTRVRTPEPSTSSSSATVGPGPATEAAETEDYFPSPSQVDPEVLRELPADIRIQIEKELQSRKKSRTVTRHHGDRVVNSVQEAKGDNTSTSTHDIDRSHDSDAITALPSPSQVDPEVLRELPADIRIQIEKELLSRKKSRTVTRHHGDRGVNSGQEAKGDSARTPTHDIDRSHDSDAITALPSLSQIDPSCLSALPASMQQELQEAYARQNNHQPNRAGMMNLKQAKSPSKSPSKSPNKKSPLKNSPQFKVPRGKPSKRGRKKGTSKKLVFSDTAKNNAQAHRTTRNAVQKTSTSDTSSSICPPSLNSDRDNTNIINIEDDIHEPVRSNYVTQSIESDQTCNQSTSTGINNENQPSGSKSKHHKYCEDAHTETDTDNQSTTHYGIADCDSVNLCGAVDVDSVRSLLQEWISSTPEPQSVDERILMDYLQDLIDDKNLELVDLVLKFMHRSIKRQESLAWKESLLKIFIHTQSVVQSVYGSRLCSISP